ncbi:MAG: HEAT repeat domain-containing protein [Acidobacteria bacterium]|nr:HEAT repeat domain-containing protein [Acidobacteriota bacterium]
MSILVQNAPLTPLDELRAHLARHSEEGAWTVHLHHLLQRLQQMSLPELGSRLLKPTSSKPLKKAILALTSKFDWPEWVPFLHKALLTEPDLGLFDEGCVALGRIATRDAFEALQDIQEHRPDPDRRLILHRELAGLEPTQPLSFYLGRLAEGEGNPRLAHQGGRFLSVQASPADLPALVEAYQAGDPLSSKLALRAIAGLPGGAAGEFLARLFEQLQRHLQDYLDLEDLITRVQPLQRTHAREELAKAYTDRLHERCPEESAALLQAIGEENANPGQLLDHMAPHVEGHLEGFLAEGLQVLVEGKVARFTALLTERLEESHRQQGLLATNLDLVAMGLHRQVMAGYLPATRAVPLLAAALRRFSRQDGIAFAFCWLVEPADTESLALVRAEQDPKRRMFLLDNLGTREDDDLTPFFLQMLEDPIVEVGQRAIHQLGKLPSAFPVVMERFQSGQPDQIRLALRIFGENRTRAAAEVLTQFVSDDERDELLIEAVEALGTIQYPPAAKPLLELLHDGKPARLQLVLARSLGAMHTPEAALGLLAKAPGLKLPQVLILCLEGLLATFQGFENPVPEEALPALDQLLTRCLDEREGEGIQLRAILATQGLFCFDQGLYAKWKDRFSDVLFDLRTKTNWDRDTNEKVAAVVKELGQRSAALNLIASKEEAMRSAIRGIPEKGPSRAEMLLALREKFSDPDLILRPQMALEVAAWVHEELKRPASDWREVARLCEIGSYTHQDSLIAPIREHLLYATGLGLRSATRDALLRLGVPEEDHHKHPPFQSILLLEPSAFFRKKTRGSLEPTWKVREAGGREEAEALLKEASADLLITELQDAGGDLRPWIEAQWETRRVRQVLLACASRDVAAFLEHPWVLGVLNKPFSPEALLKALEP